MKSVKFLVAIFCFAIIIQSCDDLIPTTRMSAEVKTGDVSLIHFNDAQILGNVLSSLKDIEVLVEYGKTRDQLSQSQRFALREAKEMNRYENGSTVIWYDYECVIDLSNLEDGSEYFYRLVAVKGGQRIEGETKCFTTFFKGPINLDLESGNLWAAVNVGADYPTDFGNFYAWGETKEPFEKNRYDWSSYLWCNGSRDNLLKYCLNARNGDNGFFDGKTELEDSDDVAKKKLGEKWQTPSIADFTELIKTCVWEEYKVNGVWGILFSSKKDQTNPKKKMFMPYAGYQDGSRQEGIGYRGYYWTRNLEESLYSGSSAYAANLRLNDSPSIGRGERCLGESIRPVWKK